MTKCVRERSSDNGAMAGAAAAGLLHFSTTRWTSITGSARILIRMADELPHYPIFFSIHIIYIYNNFR